MIELSDVLLDDEDRWILGAYTWHVRTDGYVGGRIDGIYVLLHTILIDPAPDRMVVDHKNRIKHDCRKDNLRYATRRGNRMNSDVCDNSYMIKQLDSGRHQVRIKRKGKHICLGTFNLEADAVAARDSWLENEDVECEYLAHNGQGSRSMELFKAYRP